MTMTTTGPTSTASARATAPAATILVDVRGTGGDTVGTVDLPAHVFGVQTNVPLIHQVVVAQLASARQGTHATRSRGAVSGGGKKPYRQKGTGRARQGSTRAPQFAGGGVVHVVEGLSVDGVPSTRAAASALSAISDRRTMLVVLARDEPAAAKSVRNLPDLHVLWADQLNTYDVLCADDVVFTSAGLDEFLARSERRTSEASAARGDGAEEDDQ